MVENWINDPNMDYSDIYHYLVESPKPLSHRDSGKYTDNVSRDCLISVHSHCQ